MNTLGEQLGRSVKQRASNDHNSSGTVTGLNILSFGQFDQLKETRNLMSIIFKSVIETVNYHLGSRVKHLHLL